MKAVIHARYSSDNQREENIEGQIRECTAYAEKNGITMDYQDRDNVNLPLYEKQLREAEKGIENLVNAIQQGIFTKSTRERLEQMESLKEALEQKIALEKLENPRISEEFMHFWLLKFRKLDIRQQSHRKMLIDTFVNLHPHEEFHHGSGGAQPAGPHLFPGGKRQLVALADAVLADVAGLTAPIAAEAQAAEPTRWVCSICGYVYEGETLPEDYTCPLCGMGADKFIQE